MSRLFPMLVSLVAGLACGPSAAEEPEEEDVESFSTTFPPVTTSSTTSDASGTSSGSASTGGTSDTSGTSGGTAGGTLGTTSGDTTGTQDDASSAGVTGGSGESTGTEGDTTGGVSDPLSIYDDEFDDAASLADWTLKSTDEGLPDEHIVLNISTTAAGFLVVRPTAGGWFDDYSGFFLFKVIDADFMVETWVNAGAVSSAASPPTRPFNSAGLLVRDPDHAPGTEHWVTHNVGFQDDEVATEGKVTVDSFSSLTLFSGPQRGVLRICKVGSSLVLARRLEGESEFVQTHSYSNLAELDGPAQVGLMVSGWNSTGAAPNTGLTPDIEARFDYIRFRSIDALSACVEP